jgi:F0F1-type ATP synthase membrane subunit b/b'
MMLAIFVLVLALSITAFLLLRAKRNQRANLNKKDEVVQENADLLDDTRVKAIKIIDDANNQALDIISKATLLANASSESFKENLSHTSSAQIKEFEKATSDFTALYFQILQDLKTKNIEVFQNVSKDIEANTEEEVKNFKESMQKLTTSSQDEISKKINTDYEALKIEIENYKKEKLQKVDREIYELLEEISKLVLGKALNLSEQEDLIEKSIAKAKKEGIFGQSK